MRGTYRQGWRAVTVAALVLGLAGGDVVAAPPYERPADRTVADTLPPELAAGPLHRVRDPIVADGYMLHFTVDSSFGAFEATGIGALRKLLHELHAIAELRKIKGTEAWAKQVVDSGTSSLQFVGKLLTHPVDTASGLPKGLYKGMEAVGASVTGERDPSQDSRMKTVLLQSGKKREYAAALKVDPYSSNSVLQKELNSVAWAAALGSWTVTAATAPIGGAAATVLTMTKFGDVVGDYLKVQSPADLRVLNGKRLDEMKIPSALATRYLDHPHFTPRHDTILVEALTHLGGVQGREMFLETALGAEDEADANFYVNLAQMLHGYHGTVSPLSDIRRVGPLLVARAANGRVFVPLPLDYGVWTERAERVSDQLKAAAPGARIDFWVMGAVSARAKQELTAKGIDTAELINRRIEILD
jgi:hypothetical protein